MEASEYAVPSIASEFLGAALGDKRRTQRLLSLAETLSAAPDRPLPRVARDDAELEALYRFVNNDAVEFGDLLQPHFAATADRASGYAAALAIHDITELSFPVGEERRAGCGSLGQREGFRLAPALVLAGDGSNRPLGLLSAQTWVVDAARTKKKGKKKRGNTWGRTDSKGWYGLVEGAENALQGQTELIHLGDREAGTYEMFAWFDRDSRRYVLRLTTNRLVEELDSETGTESELVDITELAAKLENVVEVDVSLCRRKAKYLTQRNPPRAARTTRLGFAAKRIRLWRRRALSRDLPESVELNLVVVKELSPQEGLEPIEWLLATNEPIDTPEDIARIVDYYRARWTIEEFFKALKTGCRIQERQFQTRAALEKILAIFLVIAWKILEVRTAARTSSDAPANTVFTELQLTLLRANPRRRLPPNPTVRDALLCVAALGGHIKNNGEPGWHVLARGMERLVERTVGCLATLQMLGLREK